METRSKRKTGKAPTLALLETPAAMSPGIRELFMRVTDGDQRLLPMMHQLWHYRRHPELLNWLIGRRITGPLFFQFVKVEFDGSVMAMVKYILSVLDSDQKTVIEYGRDWVEPF